MRAEDVMPFTIERESINLFSQNRQTAALQKCALAYSIMKDAIEKCARLEVTIQARSSPHARQSAVSLSDKTLYFYHPDKKDTNLEIERKG